MIQRKLNVENRYTDLFADALGKTFRVKTDHKTMLIIQSLFKKKNASEADDEKAMKLLLGESAWAEIKEYLESQENYINNLQVTQIEIYSIAMNLSFEEMARRFQKQQDQ